MCVCVCACNMQKRFGVSATTRRASALRTSASRKSVSASLGRRLASPPPLSVMAAPTRFQLICCTPAPSVSPTVTTTSSSSSRSSRAAPTICAITSPAARVRSNIRPRKRIYRRRCDIFCDSSAVD